jgi:hypothetical protein
MDAGRAIDSVFKIRDQRIRGGGIRPWRARRRHHPGMQHADGTFGLLGRLIHVRQVDLRPRKISALELLVVAAGAVAIDNRLLNVLAARGDSQCQSDGAQNQTLVHGRFPSCINNTTFTAKD